MRVPTVFEDFRDLLRQRDHWLQALEKGEIARREFHVWCVRASQRYREQTQPITSTTAEPNNEARQ